MFEIKLEREIETLKRQVRVANRQISSLETANVENASKIAEIEEENTKLRDQISEKTNDYREKLLELLQRVSGDESDINIEDPTQTKQKLYNSLVDTHKTRFDLIYMTLYMCFFCVLILFHFDLKFEIVCLLFCFVIIKESKNWKNI